MSSDSYKKLDYKRNRIKDLSVNLFQFTKNVNRSTNNKLLYLKDGQLMESIDEITIEELEQFQVKIENNKINKE